MKEIISMMELLIKPLCKLVIFVGLISPFYIKRFKLKLFLDNLKFRRITIHKISIIILIIFASIVFQIFLFERFPFENKVGLGYIIYFIVSSVIITPLLEETFFRGYLSGVLTSLFKINYKRTIFYLMNIPQISLFVVFHVKAISIPALVLDAFITTFVYYYTKKNLLGSIMYHASINLTVLVAGFL